MPTIDPSALQQIAVFSIDADGDAGVIPGTGASNLGKAEDSAHTSGDVGVEVLAVRNDNGATLTNTDLDYSPIAVTRQGALFIAQASVLNGDAQAVSQGAMVSSGNNTSLMGTVRSIYNGSTYDRERNNVSSTFQTQTADSVATLTSSDITNYNHTRLKLIITFSDKQGTVDFTPKVQGKTPAGAYYDIWTAAAAVSANSTVTYDLGPTTTNATITESKIVSLPRTLRVVLTYNGAGAGNSFDVLGEYELGL